MKRKAVLTRKVRWARLLGLRCTSRTESLFPNPQLDGRLTWTPVVLRCCLIRGHTEPHFGRLRDEHWNDEQKVWASGVDSAETHIP